LITETSQALISCVFKNFRSSYIIVAQASKV
jgi:hypothetical protein